MGYLLPLVGAVFFKELENEGEFEDAMDKLTPNDSIFLFNWHLLYFCFCNAEYRRLVFLPKRSLVALSRRLGCEQYYEQRITASVRADLWSSQVGTNSWARKPL